MSAVFIRWVCCNECDGSGKVWMTLKGAGVMTTTTCWRCHGFRQVQQRMTTAEVLEVMGLTLSPTLSPSEPAPEASAATAT